MLLSVGKVQRFKNNARALHCSTSACGCGALPCPCRHQYSETLPCISTAWRVSGYHRLLLQYDLAARSCGRTSPRFSLQLPLVLCLNSSSLAMCALLCAAWQVLRFVHFGGKFCDLLASSLDCPRFLGILLRMLLASI